jgi:hypothetical protein
MTTGLVSFHLLMNAIQPMSKDPGVCPYSRLGAGRNNIWYDVLAVSRFSLPSEPLLSFAPATLKYPDTAS